MSFFLKWLKPETSSRIGMRPHRTLELAAKFDEAYDRVMRELNRKLGANISVDDRKTGFIEATFGLINSERLRVNVESVDEAHTRVRIEAYYPAGMTIAEKSANVDALANAVEAGIAP